MINYPRQTRSWSHPKRLRTPKDFAASFGGARGESIPGPLEKKGAGATMLMMMMFYRAERGCAF